MFSRGKAENLPPTEWSKTGEVARELAVELRRKLACNPNRSFDRYEVNVAYREAFEAAGLKMTGVSPDGLLPEIVEREDHPWFIGVQFHPELKSRPFDPHPLYASFIAAAVEQSRLV